jgi:hypothetical protein
MNPSAAMTASERSFVADGCSQFAGRAPAYPAFALVDRWASFRHHHY